MSKAIRTALSFDQWPDNDKKLWQAACAPGGLFDRDGPASHWSEKTQLQVQKGYGKWLWALQQHGILTSTLPPSQRVTEQSLRNYHDTLTSQRLSSVTLVSRMTDLMEAIRVMEPGADLTLLRQLVSTLQRRATPSRNKAARIREPAEIWSACADHMSAVITGTVSLSFHVATRYRDAMALSFLSWMPLRLRNLTALTLGQNMMKRGKGWHVSFTAAQTKDKSPLTFYLPDHAPFQDALSFYLAEVRPPLLSEEPEPDSQHAKLEGPLWISTRGRAMSSHALYYAITRCSERLLGAPLNPHLLRDCAVSSITANAPEFTLAAARVLGHSQLSTTLTHYDQASMLKAGQYHAEILEEIKNAATRRKSAENPYSPEDAFYDPWPLEDKEQI